MVSIQRYLDISEASDLETFRRLVLESADWLDFRRINACMVIEEPGRDARFVEIAGNTPSEYVPISTDPGASKADPVLQRLRHSSTPVFYDQAAYVQAGAADSWEHQAPFGYRTGICVALHLPDRRHFLLGMDRDDAIAERHLGRMMADLQLLAVHVNAGAQRLLTPAAEAEPPRFTPREMEVLRWAVQGKSNPAIGIILGLSEDTVKFHVKNVLRKLNTSTKVEAVARAITMGLVR